VIAFKYTLPKTFGFFVKSGVGTQRHLRVGLKTGRREGKRVEKLAREKLRGKAVAA